MPVSTAFPVAGLETAVPPAKVAAIPVWQAPANYVGVELRLVLAANTIRRPAVPMRRVGHGARQIHCAEPNRYANPEAVRRAGFGCVAALQSAPRNTHRRIYGRYADEIIPTTHQVHRAKLKRSRN